MARWSYMSKLSNPKEEQDVNFRSWDWKKEKRNVVQRINKLYELKLHHSVVQQLSWICHLPQYYVHFFMYGWPFFLLCIKVCHFHQAMCFFSSPTLWFLFRVRKCRDRCWKNKENIFEMFQDECLWIWQHQLIFFLISSMFYSRLQK